ncbi:hypothetical protein BB560_001813 [Smittium megazygosporum]|uniref:CSC1/OSCA1-like 7TM region domain-containing protein n=1 Tax=Smittium megazygosporum TaxID=133381 RepID=A0A2T9ZGJ1_9FUNG|nr:hypothetical protein BB560_001813 [Smittium megazygosporum]
MADQYDFSPISMGSFYVTLGSSVLIFLINFLIFCLIRKSHVSIYAPRTISLDESKKAHPLPDTTFSWVYSLYKIHDLEILEKTNLDSYMTLRALKFQYIFFAIFAVLTICTVIPILTKNSPDYSDLDSLSAARLLQGTNWESYIYISLKKEAYLKSRQNHSDISATLMVYGLKGKFLSETYLKQSFGVFSSEISSVTISRNTFQLEKLVRKRENAVKNLECYLTSYIIDCRRSYDKSRRHSWLSRSSGAPNLEIPAPNTPKILKFSTSSKSRNNLFYKKVDAIYYYTHQLIELNKQIRIMSETYSKVASLNTLGFVTFKDEAAARIISQSILGSNLYLAPPTDVLIQPEDVIWKNISFDNRERAAASFISYGCIILLFIGSMATSIAISGLFDLERFLTTFKISSKDSGAFRYFNSILAALMLVKAFAILGGYLLMPPSLWFRVIKPRFKTMTPRERVTHEKSPAYDWPVMYSQNGLIFLIGLVFFSISPLIAPICATYFFLNYHLHRYKFMYVFNDDLFSYGGLLFKSWIRLSFVNIFIAETLWVIIMVANIKATKSAIARIIISVFILLGTIYSHHVMKKHFYPKFEHLPLSMLSEADRKQDGSLASKEEPVFLRDTIGKNKREMLLSPFRMLHTKSQTRGEVLLALSKTMKEKSNFKRHSFFEKTISPDKRPRIKKHFTVFGNSLSDWEKPKRDRPSNKSTTNPETFIQGLVESAGGAESSMRFVEEKKRHEEDQDSKAIVDNEEAGGKAEQAEQAEGTDIVETNKHEASDNDLENTESSRFIQPIFQEKGFSLVWIPEDSTGLCSDLLKELKELGKGYFAIETSCSTINRHYKVQIDFEKIFGRYDVITRKRNSMPEDKNIKNELLRIQASIE